MIITGPTLPGGGGVGHAPPLFLLEKKIEMEKLNNYKDDLDLLALPSELLVLWNLRAMENASHFEEIKQKVMTKMNQETRNLIGNVIKLMTLVLVGAATSVTPKRSP